MAINPVAGSATPYSKQLTIVGTGAEELFTLGDIAAQLDEGPLKKVLLGQPSTGINAFNINGLRGNEIRIYDVAAVPADAAATKGGTRRIRWVSNANPALAGLSCTVAALTTITIELRLNHSTQA